MIFNHYGLETLRLQIHEEEENLYIKNSMEEGGTRQEGVWEQRSIDYRQEGLKFQKFTYEYRWEGLKFM